MTIQQAFPNLRPGEYSVTSPVTPSYNCIAWAANDTSRWWWPSAVPFAYWPPSIPREETLDAFIAAYGTIGYATCADAQYEAGYEKVAIYVAQDGKPTHAARQLPNGKWTSKLGKSNDIEHLLNGVDGPSYGRIAVFMRRQIQSPLP